MSVKEAVKDRFGRAAAGYAVSAVHVGGPDLEEMLRASGLPADTRRPGRLLDVGTGAGHTAFAFAGRIAQVEALDLTAEMLDQVASGARERGLDNIACRLGDAEALPYPDGSFDYVTSRLCAHHFEDVEAFAREAARVLKPSGCFLLVDSLASETASLDTFFNTFELLRDPSHVRNYSRSQWLALLAGAGLGAEVLGETYLLEQDFEDWVERIGTPATGIAHLRTMFESPADAARQEFGIRTEGGRVGRIGVPCGLIRGWLR